MIVMGDDRRRRQTSQVLVPVKPGSRPSTTENNKDEALQIHERGRAGMTHKIESLAFMEGPVVYLDTPGRRLCCATKQVGYATRRYLRQNRSIAIKVASLAATSMRGHSDEIRHMLIDGSENSVWETWATCVERRGRGRRGTGFCKTRGEISMCRRNEKGGRSRDTET
jgi:hypothetical protein